MNRILGPETGKNYQRRLAEGFFDKYLSGDSILDIGYRGGNPNNQPITEKAIDIELDYPGYDGLRLPFDSESQDAVFASHCLEHIKDYRAALADWYRVLKISGFLIVAVPSQFLYERKAMPPSRFNADHKRFYTPQSLLAEIDEALPLGGYRVQSLRDIDDGFDYSIPPERHAAGTYEIELVLRKVPVQPYVQKWALQLSFLRQSQNIQSTMLAGAIAASRSNDDEKVRQIQAYLMGIPLPPFIFIIESLQQALAPEPIDRDEVARLLKTIVRTIPFDENWYLSRSQGVRDAVAKGIWPSGHEHFVAHGYFEGWVSTPNDPFFG